jgi:galactose-1-phosphate uridylyltransferase
MACTTSLLIGSQLINTNKQKGAGMKIAEILSEYGYNFSARMECEHCGHTAKITSGYHDNHYHARVIPAMRCRKCGKNRAGELEHTDAGVTPCAA